MQFVTLATLLLGLALGVAAAPIPENPSASQLATTPTTAQALPDRVPIVRRHAFGTLPLRLNDTNQNRLMQTNWGSIRKAIIKGQFKKTDWEQVFETCYFQVGLLPNCTEIVQDLVKPVHLSSTSLSNYWKMYVYQDQYTATHCFRFHQTGRDYQNCVYHHSAEYLNQTTPTSARNQAVLNFWKQLDNKLTMRSLMLTSIDQTAASAEMCLYSRDWQNDPLNICHIITFRGPLNASLEAYSTKHGMAFDDKQVQHFKQVHAKYTVVDIMDKVMDCYYVHRQYDPLAPYCDQISWNSSNPTDEYFLPRDPKIRPIWDYLVERDTGPTVYVDWIDV